MLHLFVKREHRYDGYQQAYGHKAPHKPSQNSHVFKQLGGSHRQSSEGPTTVSVLLQFSWFTPMTYIGTASFARPRVAKEWQVGWHGNTPSPAGRPSAQFSLILVVKHPQQSLRKPNMNILQVPFTAHCVAALQPAVFMLLQVCLKIGYPKLQWIETA